MNKENRKRLVTLILTMIIMGVFIYFLSWYGVILVIGIYLASFVSILIKKWVNKGVDVK